MHLTKDKCINFVLETVIFQGTAFTKFVHISQKFRRIISSRNRSHSINYAIKIARRVEISDLRRIRTPSEFRGTSLLLFVSTRFSTHLFLTTSKLCVSEDIPRSKVDAGNNSRSLRIFSQLFASKRCELNLTFVKFIKRIYKINLRLWESYINLACDVIKTKL